MNVCLRCFEYTDFCECDLEDESAYYWTPEEVCYEITLDN